MNVEGSQSGSQAPQLGVERSDTARLAVFLSCASQDIKPVQRLCDALRAAGIEVWFDHSELRGNEAWKQQIQQKISTCGLFVPVISNYTNSRSDGNFRLEWKLAVQRSNALAGAQPFLVPIAIDMVRQAEARVPEEFHALKWTWLFGTAPTAGFVGQIKRLLNPADAGTAVTAPASGTASGEAYVASNPAMPGWGKGALIACVFVAFAVVVYFAIR